MPAYERLGHVSSGYVRSVQVRSDYAMLDQVMPGWSRLGLVSS
jgi:hypothetical protein